MTSIPSTVSPVLPCCAVGSERAAFSALGLVRLLRQSDAQVFMGWRHHSGMLDAAALRALGHLVAATEDILKDCQNNAIVMTGWQSSLRDNAYDESVTCRLWHERSDCLLLRAFVQPSTCRAGDSSWLT